MIIHNFFAKKRHNKCSNYGIKMKKYFVVDCDNPVPNFLDGGSENKACSIDMRKRIIFRLLKNFSIEERTNIIIGVTRGNVSGCEMALQIVMQMINRVCNRNVFKNYCVLNVETGKIEAGLDSPPDIEGELHILSDRPRTRALFEDKNCWWNEHSKLKRSIGKISKNRRKKQCYPIRMTTLQ
uniref:Wsv270-like protein n=1 Tax=Metopaulias depressus WSSV-like virus TaxID=1675544 RepID=A0A0K0VLT2_9VIRU|nr:wsv270-like protein [Metopaulias depressus WSSV-like virus]